MKCAREPGDGSSIHMYIYMYMYVHVNCVNTALPKSLVTHTTSVTVAHDEEYHYTPLLCAGTTHLSKLLTLNT